MALVRPLPGAQRLLSDLRGRGLAIAVLTNGPSTHQRMKLEVSGLAADIDAVAISAELGVAKPEPEAFRRAAAIWYRRRNEPQPRGARLVTALDEVPAALALDPR